MAFNLDFLKDLVPQGTNIFGAAPSANMKQMAEMGLLGEGNYQDMLDKANKQSLFQGLLATGLSYAAQPKNQGYGSIFPYLAKAGLSGMQAAQSPYDQMGKDAMMNQKLQDMKRSRDMQSSQDEFRKNYALPTGTTSIDPTQQVPVAPFQTRTLQDDTIGSTLMGGSGYNPNAQPTAVAPMYDVVNANPMDALRLGVSQDQLKTTTTAPSSQETDLVKAYKAGAITYGDLITGQAAIAKAKKPDLKEIDTTKDLYIDGVLIRPGIPKESETKYTNLPDRLARGYEGTINPNTGVEYKKGTTFANLAPVHAKQVLKQQRKQELEDAMAVEGAKFDSPTGKIERAKYLKNGFDQRMKDNKFYEYRDNMNKIQASVESGTPISDVATATSIMKMLDPGSVVRESELEVALKANGLLDRMKNWKARNLEGKKLTATQRQEFNTLAKDFFDVAQKTKNELVNEYANFSKEYEVDPKLIIGNYGARKYVPGKGLVSIDN